MQTQILLYISTKYLNELTFYLCLLCTCGLTWRAIVDFMEAYEEPDIGFKQALIKIKKRVFNVIIAVSATSLVSWFNSFY